MKNKIIALIIIITCFLIVCIGKVVDGSQKNRSDFYLPGNALKDEYGTKYEKEWKSSDNRICFIMDNKLEFYGRSHYHGTYLDPNNMTHKIFVECEPLNDGINIIIVKDYDKIIDYNEQHVIASGLIMINKRNKEFSLICDYPEYGDEITYCEESAYNENGEIIVFHQVL